MRQGDNYERVGETEEVEAFGMRRYKVDVWKRWRRWSCLGRGDKGGRVEEDGGAWGVMERGVG